MPDHGRIQPPAGCRWLLRAAAWLVPRRARSEWSARWGSRLRDWWTLVERGELAGDRSAGLLRPCAAAFADAFWLRLSKQHLRDFVRGPAFVLLTALFVLVLLAALTHGLATTRAVFDIARAVNFGLPGSHELPPLDARRSNMLFAYTAPIVFALAIGVMLVAIGRLSLHRYGWRYWSFLAAKTAAVLAVVPLVWIEAGAALRAHMPHGETRILLGALAFTLAFIFFFGWALWWSFADQRLRCPVCLHLLAMPVTIGSWASVFEPPETELLCDEGHGSLCLSEADHGAPDRWTPLDASWRDLFEKEHTDRGARPV